MDLKVPTHPCDKKILRRLTKTREIRVMKLVDKATRTYNDSNRNLPILETEGIMMNDYHVKVKHEKVRITRLNRDNPKTILLQAPKMLPKQ